MGRASLFTTFCALALLRCASGQVTSNIVGTLTDPDNAVVPNVEVQLTHLATGAVRTTSSTSVGIFRFTQLMPGDYTVTIKAAGFKAYSHTDIVLAASETRDLGNIRLALGTSVEQISITADATPVQTASSEKSVLVDAGELRNIAIRGRDVFAMLAFLPGIIDTNATSRDSETAYNIQGIAINGNTSWINAALDGQTNVGIGSGNITQGAPNMDAVQEVKVLSSNYQAEYGRNSGGTISLVTKSGSKEFHGSAFWTHRHEQFNANSWNNNRNNTRKSAYRYNVAGWSLGGPVFIPGHFNTQKTKLFFFASQEFTRQFLSSSLGKTTVPTTLERNGDFSQSFNINGSLIVIKDPTTGKSFPNNVIPPSSVNALGGGFLKLLPAPNYTPAPGSPDYLRYNYAAENTGQHPRDNHVIRADTYLTNKLSGFLRFVRNSDSTALPFGGNSFLYASQVNPMPDFVFGGSLGYAISPTMYNEITAGRAASTWDYWITDPKQVARGIIPGLPKLFPITYSETNQLYEYLPAFSFGGTPNSAAYFGYGSASRYNPTHNDTFNDNFSWVHGTHSVKAGIALERGWKLQPQGNTMAALGNYNFGTSSTNPLDTGNGFANAFLGNFTSYSEATTTLQSSVVWWTAEWYLQDSWRVSRRLTLDVGLRFYHQTTPVDELGNFSGFNPNLYNIASRPRQYTAGWLNGMPNGTRVAVDPLTGATAPYQALGAFVPNSGKFANGAVAYGKDGVPLEPYSRAFMPWPAPRFGFAYDVFGNGKTAIRGGFGVYYNRLDGNQVYSMTGLSPNEYNASVYNSNIGALASGAGYVSPSSMTFYNGHTPYDSVRNGSLGIQQDIGFGTVVEASGVLNIGHAQPWTYNMNPIPMGANFSLANANPTYPTSPAPTTLPTNMQRVLYPGWNDLNFRAFGSHFIYSALQVSVRRRARNGLQYALSYTWSKDLGTTSIDALAGVGLPACVGCNYTVNNESRNYGSQGIDRTHVLAINYSYEIPKLGRRLNSKILGVITDHWILSGVTQASTGAPYNPGFGFSPSRDLTGSSSESARFDVAGDGAAIPSQPGVNRMDRVYINTSAYAIPAGNGASIGNLGVNTRHLPGYINWDASLAKSIPLKGERRALRIRVEAYNVFNHPEVNGINTSATFNAANVNINNQWGKITGTRPARILSGAFRFEF